MTFAGRASAVDSERGLVIPGSIVREFVGGFGHRSRRRLLADGGCDEEVDDVCTAIDFRLRGRVPRVCRRCAERTVARRGPQGYARERRILRLLSDGYRVSGQLLGRGSDWRAGV